MWEKIWMLQQEIYQTVTATRTPPKPPAPRESRLSYNKITSSFTQMFAHFQITTQVFADFSENFSEKKTTKKQH